MPIQAVFGDRQLGTCVERHVKKSKLLTATSFLSLCLNMAFVGSIHSSPFPSYLYQSTEEQCFYSDYSVHHLLPFSVHVLCVLCALFLFFNFPIKEKRNKMKKAQGRRDYLCKLPICFHCSYQQSFFKTFRLLWYPSETAG